MNVVILKGNITRDPEIKYTPKGTACVEIGLAVNEVWFNDANEKQEEVTFLDCRAWGRNAEAIAKSFSKGKPILINGKLKQERWDDKTTGKPRSKTLVIIERWEFAGDLRSRVPEEPEGHRSTSYASPRAAATNSNPTPGPIADGMEEDDIPF